VVVVSMNNFGSPLWTNIRLVIIIVVLIVPGV
jgi:hypothetical protein